MASTLTLEQIETVSDIWAGFTLMDRYAVPKENCSCLEDMKERLRLHYEKSRGKGKSVEAAQDVISSLRNEDETKREDLSQLFHETLASLRELDDQIKGHLVQEGSVKNMEADLESHMESLKSNECPILVVGETSSGKSSLLNLLLGQDLLPQSLLSCTSIMCKIRYGPTMRAKVKQANGVVTEIPLEGSGSPVEKLTKFVFKHDRGETTEGRSVEIFVPIELLKTGVYIIDTPGFGENSSMDKLLLDYISNNDIFAFIYVIKSDNAGGVQEDRLQRFLRFIVEQQKARHVTNFDPRAAIFVCNRWDLVPEKERATVKADTMTKLGRCWPDLQDGQVFCLSTTGAMLQRRAGYISEDFSILLDGIQRLIPIGLRRKIHRSYR
ncbi:hypothetical protein LSH36_491g00038 [Paralvinella palmiformis]|uniref:Dynamin N-terminal domain-containing protein n=1 Tax=Paralvinella palmiformis TaxID=53620 RepID=A0AAD9MWP6_9ANNE|nr:hypothetical protein LSH36_491g00038 [Paralvinella palmiformis]